MKDGSRPDGLPSSSETSDHFAGGAVADGGAVQRKILSGSLWGLVSAMLSMPLSLLAVTILSRRFGAADFGTYATYAFLLPMVVALSDVGLSNSFNRRATLAYGAGDMEELKRSAREALSWSALRAPVSCVVGALVLHNAAALGLFSVYIASTTVTSGAALVLQASVRAAALSRLAIAAGAAGIAASVAAALLGAGPAIVFAAGVALQGLTNLVQIVMVARADGLRRACMTPIALRRARVDASFGVVTFVSAQLTMFMTTRSELLFFKSHQSHDRGVYAGAFSAGNRITIPLDALQGPIGVGLVIASAGDAQRLHRGLRRALRLDAALFALAAAPVLYASAALAAVIFPAGFTGVVIASITLAATSVVMSGLHPLQSYFFAIRAFGPPFRAAVVGVTANLLASALLVRAYGLTGAVTANCLGCIVYALALIGPLLKSELRAFVIRYIIQVLTPLVIASLWVSLVLGERPSILRLVIGGALACLQTVILGRCWPYLTSADLELVAASLPRRLRAHRDALTSVVVVRPGDTEY